MTPNELLAINVNKYTEKKNNLTYLSWAWAWDQILRSDPQANYEVKTFDGLPYMRIGDSAMVWVTVTVFGKPVTVQLPVLDYRNKCIPDPNAFDINTSIMRCLTKGIAMHGLGLYIYAGEDLPMESAEEEPKVEPIKLVVNDEKGVPAAEVEMTTDSEDANAELFVEGMIKYTELCDNLKDLNSYWKNNQGQLDKLKVSHPNLFLKVRTKFSDLKQQFSQPKE
jgi:hypothetical protein